MLDMNEIIGHTCPVKCDNCNLVFGWFELNKYWNIDVGDFYGGVNESIAYIPEPEFEPFSDFLLFGCTEEFLRGMQDDSLVDVGYPVGAVGGS
jgi:hypothetical protein